MSQYRLTLLSILSTAALGVGTGLGMAQTVKLDPIVVVGEKVERSFLETTTSVGVVTSEDLENYAIFDLFDGFDRLANVRINETDGNNALQIRGLNADGISDIANAQPLISVIIDGATQNNEGIRRGLRSSWDLEQVEVLRGPQSGLYGRAALAGAVVIESKDPTFFWEAGARGFGGNNETGGAAFVISGPVIEDEVAFRASGEFRTRDLNIDYADPDNEFLGVDDVLNFRTKLLIEPEAVPGLSALFTFNRNVDQTGSRLVSGPDFFDRFLEGEAAFSELREATVDNYIAEISYDLSDTLTARSITAFIDTDLEISSAPAATTFIRDDIRNGGDITEELRLEIDDPEGTGVTGVLGAYYANVETETETDILIDLGNGLIPAQTGTIENGTETIAFYADLRWNAYGPFSLLGGLRYQRDKVGTNADTVTLAGPRAFDLQETFDVFLPKAGLAFEIDETQSVAVTAARGYRQGFSELIIGTGEQNDVDPEFVWTYELAYRFVSPELGLTLGANAFFNQYRDQQISIVNPDFPPFTNTFNIGSSRSYGAEIEGRYDLGNGLQLFGAVGLLDTEIRDLEDPVCDPSGGNCAGNDFPEAPTATVSFGGFYEHESGAFASADASYTSGFFSSSNINNDPELEIDARFLLNASIGYRTEHVAATIFAKNILNKDYLTSQRSDTSGFVGDSVTVGAALEVRF
ncbi:MAG: TonB-dependent receptor [Pseudomonadota bacterium]